MNACSSKEFGPRCEDFQPSRSRLIGGVLYQAAAGIQPSGRALPSLIPGDPQSVEEHLACAWGVNPMQQLVDAAIPPEFSEVINACASTPDEIIVRRLKARAFLHKLSVAFEPNRVKWAEALPVDSPVKGINFPLLHYVASTMGYPDTKLVNDLAVGMPIAGAVEAVPTLVSRKRPAPCSMETFREKIPERNAEAVERVRKDQGSDVARQIYEKTMREVAAGWISTPVPCSKVPASTPLTPRFAVEEHRVAGPPKIRLVDDFRASGVNSTLEVVDTSVPGGLDSFLALRTAHQRLLDGRRLLAFSVDFAHAYKHVPLLADQEETGKSSNLFLNIFMRCSHR